MAYPSLEDSDTPCPLVIDGLQEEPALDVARLRAASAAAIQHFALLELSQLVPDLKEIEAYAAQIRRHSDTLVLLGIGGSCLGAKALTSIADSADPMQFHILDNPDPVSVDAMLNACDPARTSWLFVSKSGSTLETLSQIIVVLSWLEERIGPDSLRKRCFVITEPKDSPLSKLAAHYRLPVLKHIDLGGRWACLSNIGLLPAACCGIGIRHCLLGADVMLQHTLTAPIAANRPLQGACSVMSQYQASRNIHVVMPYSDRLDFTAWYGQLLSESIGKNGKGITPLAAKGAVDQHSMLQLMLDGPDDKFFTVITAPHSGKGKRLEPALTKLCGLDYLADKTIGDVLAAFQESTVRSIKVSGRPIRTIYLHEIDAYHLGALLMYLMLETLYLAALLEVNPFDQPAVEYSKMVAKFILRENAMNAAGAPAAMGYLPFTVNEG